MMCRIQLAGLLICCLFIQLHLSGQSFWHLTNEFPGGPKTVIARSGDCLFAGLQHGIIRSCNEGDSFESSLDAEVIFSVFAATNGSVYAGGSGKIYFTENLGDSWDSVSVGTYPVIEFTENSHGGIFAISGVLDFELGYVGDGVLFSADGGHTWEHRNNGLGSYISCEHIAIDQNDRLYLGAPDEFVTGNAGLFISNNNGLLWEHINITVDGRGVIPDNISVGNTTGLSVSSEDTLYFSFTGTAVNAGVQLNTKKSIHDVGNGAHWTVYQIFGSVSWWLDRPLRDIHFAQNGDWYSSVRGSVNTGGTYFSKNQGLHWQFTDFGLGVDIFGGRSVQTFAENDAGRVYMTQLLDERIYYADTSVTTSIRPVDRDVRQQFVFPNPVSAGALLTLDPGTGNAALIAGIYDASGKVIFRGPLSNGTLRAPEVPGSYTIRSTIGDTLWVATIIVQE